MGIELARRDADGLASDPATYWAEGSDGHDGGARSDAEREDIGWMAIVTHGPFRLRIQGDPDSEDSDGGFEFFDGCGI